MPTLNISPPNEKQKLFLKAEAKHIAFGGARGGGKSWAVQTKAKLLALHYAGIRILIVRRTYPELINNHINILRGELVGIARYNDKDKVLKFDNGSTINFMYCAKDADLDRMQGVEYDIIFLDEATQLSEYQMKTITACLRGVNDFPKRVYYTCNPGGQGHGYIKRLFVDRRFEDGENPEEYEFIQSLVTDNRALMESQPDYVKQLESLPPKLREAWLYGKWDIFEGMVFEDFKDDPAHYMDRQWTHVIEPFEIPDTWKIYRSYDHGYARPFSIGYFAVSPDGQVYHFLEVYGCTKTPNEGIKWTPNQVFTEIQKLESEHRWLKGRHIIGIADPAIWDAETGESIAETAAKHQVYFSKADNRRLAGLMNFHNYLQFDENGYPMFYVFKTCKHFIRTLPLLMYDEHRPEDVDSTGEDHIYDMTRYMLQSRPIKPRVEAPPDTYKETGLFQYLDIPKENIKAAARLPRMEVITDGDI